MDDTFVLDRTENPHPRMLKGALSARAAAQASGEWDYWRGYLTAMCDATGECPQAIEEWMDRADFDQRVAARERSGT